MNTYETGVTKNNKHKSISYLHYIFCSHIHSELNRNLSYNLHKENIREKEERINKIFQVVPNNKNALPGSDIIAAALPVQK